MTPQQYIQQELEKLREFHTQKVAKEQLADEIFRLLMSKKFRKWAASPQLIKQMKSAIELNIEKNQPINLTFPHGAYKLWRLEEHHFPIGQNCLPPCTIPNGLNPFVVYSGVWFRLFLLTDLILPKIDNISFAEIDAYIAEYQKTLDFLKSYQPKNFKMTITRFESLFTSRDAFEKSLQELCLKNFQRRNPHLPKKRYKLLN